jgi:hypothetical protein
MANNISAFKDELFSLLLSTTNLDAATKTKIRNRYVVEFAAEWAARVAAGTTDNATNRAKFFIDKWFEAASNVYRDGSHRENLAAIAAPETLS